MHYKNFSAQLKQHFFLLNHKKGVVFHPFLISIGIIALLVSLFELFKYADLWSTMANAAGNTLHFCEFNHEDMVIKQIANTWSNLAYLFVGLLLLSIGLKDHLFKERHQLNNLIARHPGFTISLGLAMIYLFIGSFFYHASLTRTFQIIDVAGIYAVVITLLMYNLFKAFPYMRKKRMYTHKLLLGVGIILNIFVVIEVYKWNINIVFPILIGLFLLLHVYNLKHKHVSKHYSSYIWLAVSTMGTASTLWILDRSNVLCSPTSIFQGHAIWHILTAVAVLMTYFSYRSEEINLPKLIEGKS